MSCLEGRSGIKVRLLLLLAMKEEELTMVAHSLLTPLSHTLYHLTKSRNILTIVHNGVVPLKSLHNQQYNNNQQQQKQQPEPTFSAFESTNSTLKPALGKVFEQFIDLHILISEIPRRREDAEELFAGDEEKKEVRWINVVEVVRDDCSFASFGDGRGSGDGRERRRGVGAREGRWGVVDVKEGWELRGSFEGRGDESGGREIGREMEKQNGREGRRQLDVG